jgi:hypothetical protein
VSRVCISAFVFSCFIHPLLTTCRAHEEGRKTHPQVVLNCSKTAINPSSLPFSCLNVIRVPCPLSPVPLMDEYVDRGEAGGFGEFPPLVGTGTAYEFDLGMKTNLIFTGRVINWPDIPGCQSFLLLSTFFISLRPLLFFPYSSIVTWMAGRREHLPLTSCWVITKFPQFSESST